MHFNPICNFKKNLTKTCHLSAFKLHNFLSSYFDHIFVFYFKKMIFVLPLFLLVDF